MRADEIRVEWPDGVTRPWAGPDCWTNPLEDWRVHDGKLENIESGGNRNVVLLSAELTDKEGAFRTFVTIDQLSERELDGGGVVGFVVGRRGEFDDYRDSAVYGQGFVAGIAFDGKLFLGSPLVESPTIPLPLRNVRLELSVEPTDGIYLLTLKALDTNGKVIAAVERTGVDPSWLTGLVGLIASTKSPAKNDLQRPRPPRLPAMPETRAGEARFAFSDWTLSGEKVRAHPERAFGPILWTTYTLANDGTLKFLVQLAPVDTPGAKVTLKVGDREIVESEVDPQSRTASFQLDSLDPSISQPFRVSFHDVTDQQHYVGTIRAIPKGPKLVVAALCCNDSTGFPHNLLVRNVTAQQPDLVAFLGDQIYEGIGGYGFVLGEGDRAIQSYLRKYYMHGWAWREVLRDLPSITIPDDHDVFHGNLWGDGGQSIDTTLKSAFEQQDSGGYKQPPEFVNVVHRTQTGNLPNPFDPKPCESGISVYFTSLRYGPLDFAILADRQFKSAPKPLLPKANIVNGWPRNLQWDPKTEGGHPDAQLLGERQERFLAHWAEHRDPVAPFRVVLSQTPWCAVQTLPRDVHSDSAVPKLTIYPLGEYAPDDEPKADFDTNGWPQEKRNLALKLMKKAGAIHVTGDQHLGTTGQYGIDDWEDGPWWITTPATANVFPRRWMPTQPGSNTAAGSPRYTGRFEDAYGNKITVHAVANPHDIDREPSRLFDRAVGYGILRFDTQSGEVSVADWPYWAAPDLPSPDDRPYPGWPIVIEK